MNEKFESHPRVANVNETMKTHQTLRIHTKRRENFQFEVLPPRPVTKLTSLPTTNAVNSQRRSLPAQQMPLVFGGLLNCVDAERKSSLKEIIKRTSSDSVEK